MDVLGLAFNGIGSPTGNRPYFIYTYIVSTGGAISIAGASYFAFTSMCMTPGYYMPTDYLLYSATTGPVYRVYLVNDAKSAIISFIISPDFRITFNLANGAGVLTLTLMLFK